MTTEYQLSLVVKAVDKATGPLRALAAKLAPLTAPIKALKKEWELFDKASNFSGAMKAFGGVSSAARGVAGEFFSLGAKLAGMASVAGVLFATVVKGAVDAGDKLGEMADRVGLSVDVFASLQHSAAQADVDQEQFNTAIDRFNKSLGEAKAGGGAFLGFLKKVSPALANEVLAARSTEEALSLMADAFSRIDDPAKSAALSSAAFGKSGLQMGRWLHSGSAAIQAQQRRFMELAGSQEQFARGAGDLDNAMREAELAFTGLRNAAAGALFPALTSLAKVLSNFLAKNRDGLRAWAERTGAAIQRWVDSGGFERLTDFLGGVADAVGAVIRWLGPLGTLLAATAVLVAPLAASFGTLAGAVASLVIEAAPLAIVFGPLIAATLAFTLAAGSLAILGKTIYDNWGDLRFLFEDLGTTLKNTWEFGIKPILDELDSYGFLDAGSGVFRIAQTLGDSAVKNFISPPLAVARPAAPAQSEARVVVDFNNVPSGVRASVAPNSSQPVDLSVGYSMVAP